MFARQLSVLGKLTREFSLMSRASTTPWIFKDPNFTRKGYRNQSAKRKQYNLEGVPNAHLYYDHKTDKRIDQKRRRALEVGQRGEPSMEDTTFESIVTDLSNQDLITRASGKIFLRINQLEKLHPEKLEEVKEHISNLLGKLCQHHVHKFSRRELALLLSYTRKYRPQMQPQEFINAANYTVGLVLSDYYGGKSSLEEVRDEERFVSYITELGRMYSENIQDKLLVKPTIEKLFNNISTEMVPHLGKFRKPDHLFKVAGALSQISILNPAIVDKINSNAKELKTLSALNSYVLINKNSSLEKVKPHFVNLAQKIDKFKNIEEYRGLHDLLEAIAHMKGTDQISKEFEGVFKKALEKSGKLDLATNLSLAEALNSVQGKIPADLSSAIKDKAEESLYNLKKTDFYRYFYITSILKTPSDKVINQYLRLKQKSRDMEFTREQVQELIKRFTPLKVNENSPISRLLEELGADEALYEANSLDNRRPSDKRGPGSPPL